MISNLCKIRSYKIVLYILYDFTIENEHLSSITNDINIKQINTTPQYFFTYTATYCFSFILMDSSNTR